MLALTSLAGGIRAVRTWVTNNRGFFRGSRCGGILRNPALGLRLHHGKLKRGGGARPNWIWRGAIPAWGPRSVRTGAATTPHRAHPPLARTPQGAPPWGYRGTGLDRGAGHVGEGAAWPEDPSTGLYG